MKRIIRAVAVAAVSSTLLVGMANSSSAAPPPPPQGCTGQNQYRSAPWYDTILGNYKDESWTNWNGFYSAGRGGYGFKYRVERNGQNGGLPIISNQNGSCYA
ncbi:hypothetical protein [Cellulomonas sp. HD19AZ1]|uniref:hypothetical protein n=1 Tax=Cellulomonas sp. HD19AZ1 TaxID=2559593 RepID=UPI0010707E25|nr:hypothetical protein [Cellulomonas sp. HD19AZ1]TFH71170.1 hypothetical protein E4A51_10000 [Cellulomonas sp. HD19AZ1]